MLPREETPAQRQTPKYNTRTINKTIRKIPKSKNINPTTLYPTEAPPTVWKNRTQDEIDETIEKIADWVIRNDMEDPAILFFESIKPVAGIGARIGGAMFAGLIPLIGWGVDDRFVAFREGKDVEKVIQLIEQASEAKHTAREEQKKQDKNRKRRRRKLLPEPKTATKEEPKETPEEPPKDTTEETPQKKPWYWPF